tara:strand:+ start:69 stop:407 length:339 start_codon:yes stop_codon:yes gene_type:complete
MVLYEESEWAKARIHEYVSTGIKIQWVDGDTTQLIPKSEVDIRICEFIPCPSCTLKSGKRKRHKGPHVTFELPSDWKTVVKVEQGATNIAVKSKYFVSPDNKRFRSLTEVEQ